MNFSMLERNRLSSGASSERHHRCRVSVVIKTLNEEKNIARAVASAVEAADRVSGEVVVADSLSTDRTVEIAGRYPVRVVQLSRAEDRCCGVGPQLGYLHSRGEYVYIMDGDMRMHPDFLVQACEFLDQHTEYGGVGGQIQEQNTTSMEYVARVERAMGHMQPGEVDRLDMGGLYRREALEQVGYMSDRNLHSYEEFDLAVRLRARGWRLWRMDVPSCDHWGHDLSPYELLRRRWRSRYALGIGEVLRAGMAQGLWSRSVRDLHEVRVYAVVMVWWLAAVVLSILCGWGQVGLGAVAAAWWSLPMLMVFKKRSVPKAAYAVVAWFYSVAGLWRGLFQARRDPRAPVDSRVIVDNVAA